MEIGRFSDVQAEQQHYPALFHIVFLHLHHIQLIKRLALFLQL